MDALVLFLLAWLLKPAGGGGSFPFPSPGSVPIPVPGPAPGGAAPTPPPIFPGPAPIPGVPGVTVPAVPGVNVPTPATPAPPPSSLGFQQYVIQSGDFPAKLAQRATGNPGRWTELRGPNPNLKTVQTKDPSGKVIATHLTPFNAGQVLNIPSSWPHPSLWS